MNAESAAAIQSLVDRALKHNEDQENPMQDAITELRAIEATIRDQDASAKRELRRLRERVLDAHRGDIDAYAQALIDKQAPPKATARRIREQIKHIETLVIPGCDEGLWLLRDRTITTLRPDVEERWLLRLRSQLQRWAPPKIVQDPAGVLGSPGTEDPADAQRPEDVVQWVTDKIDAQERFDEEREAEEERKERQRAAKAAVDNAQAAAEREHYRRHAEEERGNPRKQHAPAPPPPEFNRYQWLKANGLLEDYGYVQPGTVVQAQGGREREVPIIPAEDLVGSYTEA